MFLKKSLAVAAVAAALVVAPLMGSASAHAADVPATHVAGDINGSGYGDLLVVNQAGGLSALLGVKGGTFVSSTVKLYGGWEDIDWASKIPDVNKDGYEDVLVRRTSDHSLRLYVSKGARQFEYDKQVGQNWGDIKLLTVLNKDVSGDGTPDIVALGANDELLRYSWSDKGFYDQTQIGQHWSQIQSLASVESIQGPALVAVGNDGSLINYWFGDKGLITSQKTTDIKLDPSGAFKDYPTVHAFGDINGDGLGDIVTVDAAGQAKLYVQNVKSTWTNPTVIGGGFKNSIVF